MSQQINLYQPTMREPQRVFAARSMLRMVAVVTGGLLVLHAYAWWQVDTLAAEARALGVARAAAERRFDELQSRLPKRVADPALAARVAALQAELEQTRRLATALNHGAFGNTSGLSPFLAGLARQHVAGTWLTRIDIAAGGAQIGVEGRAQAPELVPMYVQRLAAEHAFEGKVFSRLELERDPADAAVAFTLATVGIEAAEKSR